MFLALTHFLFCELQAFIILYLQFYVLCVYVSGTTLMHKIEGVHTAADVATAFTAGGGCVSSTTDVTPICLLPSVGTTTDQFRVCCEKWASNAIFTGDSYDCEVEGVTYKFDFSDYNEGNVEKEVYGHFHTGIVPIYISYCLLVIYFVVITMQEGPGPLKIDYESGHYIYCTKKIKQSGLYLAMVLLVGLMMFIGVIMLLEFAGFFKGDLSGDLAFGFIVQIFFVFMVWWNGLCRNVLKQGSVKWDNDHFKQLKIQRSPFGANSKNKVGDLPVIDSDGEANELNKPLEEGERQEVIDNMQKFEKFATKAQSTEEQSAVMKWVDKTRSFLALLTKPNDVLLEDLGRLHIRAQEARIQKICASIVDPEGSQKFKDVSIVAEQALVKIIPGYPGAFTAFCGNYGLTSATNAEIKEKADAFVRDQNTLGMSLKKVNLGYRLTEYGKAK